MEIKGFKRYNKRQLIGTCFTCNYGVYFAFLCWCRNPKSPYAYKAHAPTFKCKEFKLSRHFKFLKNWINLAIVMLGGEPYGDESSETGMRAKSSGGISSEDKGKHKE